MKSKIKRKGKEINKILVDQLIIIIRRWTCKPAICLSSLLKVQIEAGEARIASALAPSLDRTLGVGSFHQDHRVQAYLLKFPMKKNDRLKSRTICPPLACLHSHLPSTFHTSCRYIHPFPSSFSQGRCSCHEIGYPAKQQNANG